MDIEDSGNQEEGNYFVEDDSGSVFSDSTDSNEEDNITGSLPASLQAGSSRSISKAEEALHEDSESSGNSQETDSSIPAFPGHDQIVEDARRWASNFQAPQSAQDIRSPHRHSKRKKNFKPFHEVKRLKLRSYYSQPYRELLNVDIQRAATKAYQDDQPFLQTSQIGASIWTGQEKQLFFMAEASIGKNNVQDISLRIGSKSALEVQEYLCLLNLALVEKQSHDPHDLLITPADIPAATEITTECCDLLERAGQAIAARQECVEAQTEEEKWGELWLITPAVARLLEKRRREENGHEEMEGVLPAANLFNLKNWIELTERIFMNPGSPREEDNWEQIAEVGESPAVRATAFEDFHSLAVNFTKRLISTTLYCTMSRMRARDSNKSKQADVNADDVEAAVNILGVKADSRAFWKDCARRCNLQIVNDDDPHQGIVLDESDDIAPHGISYSEVEEALSFSGQRSRHRSISQPPTPRPRTSSSVASFSEAASSAAEEQEDDVGSLEEHYSSPSSTEGQTRTRDSARLLARQKARAAAVRTYETYLDSLDRKTSQEEETRIWKLLKQEMPFEFEKIEDSELEKEPKFPRDSTEGQDWREWTEYWSAWEVMENPVPAEVFERNRLRKSKVGRKREVLRKKGELKGPESDVDGEDEGEDLVASDLAGEVLDEDIGDDDADEEEEEGKFDDEQMSEARYSSPARSLSGEMAFEEGSPSRYRGSDSDDDGVYIKEE